MKISHKLYVAGGCILAGMFTTALVLSIGFSSIRETVRKERAINRITIGVYELNILLGDRLLFPNDRTIRQWRSRYDSLDALLDAEIFNSAVERNILAETRDGLDRSRNLFDRLQRSDGGGWGELDSAVSARLLEVSRAIVANTNRLSAIALGRMESVESRIKQTLLFLASVLAAMAAVGSMAVGRSIVRPIARLRDGMRAVGAGDLSRKVVIGRNDEIGDLARSFHDMIRDLSEVTVSRDRLAEAIRDRDAAEARVRETEDLYHRAAAASGIVAYYLDYASDAYKFMGDGIEELTGFAPGEFTLPVWRSITREVRPFGEAAGLPFEEAARRARSGEIETWRGDYRIVTRSGQERWVHNVAVRVRDALGTVVGSLGTLMDISERKKTEEALRQSMQLSRTLLDNFPSMVSLVKSPGREIAASNRVAVEKGAVPGRLCFSAHAGRNEPCPWCLAPEVWTTGKERHAEAEFNGAVWEISWIPVADGLYLHYMADVTGKRRMEMELQKVQKMESIAVLAGGIAHDFNNLLMAIVGNLSLAKMGAEAGDDIRGILEESEQASFRAQDLTRQLLTFSTGGNPVRAAVSIAGLLKDLVEFTMRGSALRGVLSMAEGLWPVDVDAGQIRQVVNNLVVNAKQASPEGASVRVSAANVTLAEEQDVPLPPGRYVEIAVRDEGVGIPEADHSRIFDPFYTTKPGNSGLGLAVSFSIVKKHGGHISVESRAGEGATFRVLLPASAGVPAAGGARKGPVPGSGRILVMDDDEMVRKVVCLMLESLGYEVTDAADGAEAVECYRKAREAGKRFDAVILDLTVPGGMGGKAAVGMLREIDPAVTAIVSSGYSNDPVMADYARYGFSGVVAKPYRAEELSRALSGILAGK